MRRVALWLPLLAGAALGGRVGDTDAFLPLIHDGDGWSTTITVVNLGRGPASVGISLLDRNGYRDPWAVSVKTSAGTASGNSVTATLAPGASMTVETPGTASRLTRGFAQIVCYNNPPEPLGGFAELVQRIDGRVEQVIPVPLSPEHEVRSVVPLRIAAGTRTELVWVSPTNSTELELKFRDRDGKVVLSDLLTFGLDAQLFVLPAEQWPQLAGFVGTLEWTASMPAADRYEPRILTGLAVTSVGGGQAVVLPGMTLPGDQRSSNPY